MCKIKTAEGFDFSCKTSTGKIISCFMDGREPVTANFDKIKVSYKGSISILVTRKKIVQKDGEDTEIDKEEYIALKRLKPTKEGDKKYFDSASQDLQVVSLKRKQELKVQEKANTRKKEPLKRY